MRKASEYQENEPKVWFKFYTPFLLEHWNSRKEGRSKKTLFQVLAKLHTKTCKESTVEQYFHRTKTLPKDVLSGVSLLLVETQFYERFFEIGMTPKRELHGSKRITQEYYTLVKNNLASFDEFWKRWIQLYEINYETEILAREEKEKLYDEIFQSYKSFVTEKQFFTKERALLKKIDKVLSERIEMHYEILNLFYKTCFGLAYFGFLRNLKNYKDISEYETRIHSVRNFTKDNLYELKDKLKLYNLEKKFYSEFRIHELYFLGNEILGIEITPFRFQKQETRIQLLKEQRQTLEICKPSTEDSIQYVVWYKYYEFMHLQWETIHNLENKDFLLGIEKLRKCLNYLEDFEKELLGNFARILLKIKYHKRNIRFLLSSLEILLLEKSLQKQDNSKDRERHARHLLDLEKWIHEL